MSDILPPFDKVPPEGKTVLLPPVLWERLDAIAELTKKDDPRGKGHSRNAVIRHLLEWAATEWEKDRAAKRRK